MTRKFNSIKIFEQIVNHTKLNLDDDPNIK
jgi:hypothetical protein